MSRDSATLLDIHQAARLIGEFTQGMDRAAFLADVKTQSAVLHQLLLIGEGVRRLSPQFREDPPEPPWGSITGMRNRLIHEYDAVDLEEVWATVSRDIPALVQQIVPLLPEQGG